MVSLTWNLFLELTVGSPYLCKVSLREHLPCHFICLSTLPTVISGRVPRVLELLIGIVDIKHIAPLRKPLPVFPGMLQGADIIPQSPLRLRAFGMHVAALHQVSPLVLQGCFFFKDGI